MSKRSQKALASATIMSLVLSTVVAMPTKAAVLQDLAGAGRYETAAKILDAGWEEAATVILASGEDANRIDALTVAPLAKKNDAPIMLVEPGKALSAEVLAKLVALKTTKVYIATGTGVIGADVEKQLEDAKITVKRLGGTSRYDTALNIAKEVGASKSIVVAGANDANLVDSLSISSIAAIKGMPIFISATDKLDDAAKAYIETLGVENTYVVGGTAIVSDAAVAGLTGMKRLAGAGRYESNYEVLNAFKDDAAINFSKAVYVASGADANLIDALAGSALAAKNGAPIVLAHDDVIDTTAALLKEKMTKETVVNIFGGVGAVTAAVKSELEEIQNPTSGKDLKVDSISSVKAISNSKIEVSFADGVTAVTDAASYSIVEKGTATVLKVTGAVLDGSKVVIDTDAMTAGKAYTLVAGEAKVNFTGIAKVTAAPTVSTVEATDTNTVEVTFNKVMDKELAQTAANYTLNNGATVKSAVLDSTRKIVTLTTDGVANGKLYSLTIQNVKSIDAVALSKVTKNFIGKTDTTAPSIIGNVIPVTNNRIQIKFNDKHGIDKEIAETVENYTILNGTDALEIKSVTAVANDDGIYDMVEVITATQAQGKKYTVTIKNLADASVAKNVIKKDLTTVFYGKVADTAGPVVDGARVSAKTNTMVELTFTDGSALDTATATNPENYVFNNDVKAVKVELKDADAPYTTEGKTVVITTTEMEGKNYTLTVSGVTDEFGNAMKALTGTTYRTYSFVGKVADVSAPKMNKVVALSPSKIKITFNEELNKVSAKDPTNYMLSDADGDVGTAVSATLDSTGKVVTLVTSSLTANEVYTFTVNGVSDLSGNMTEDVAGDFIAPRTDADVTAPTLSYAQAVNENEIRVYFDEPVVATEGNTELKYNVVPTDTTTPIITITADYVDSLDDGYTLVFKTSGLADNTNYEISEITILKDESNNGYVDPETNIKFYGTTAKNDNPTVTSWEQTDVNTLKVYFSENVTGAAITEYGVTSDYTDNYVKLTNGSGFTANDELSFNFSDKVTDKLGACALDVDETTNSSTSTKITPYIVDDEKPYILNVVPTNTTTIKVTYNEKLKSFGAYKLSKLNSTTGKYEVVSGVSAGFGSVKSEVLLTVPTMKSTNTYKLEVINGAADVATNREDVSEVSFEFMGTDVVANDAYITGVNITDGTNLSVYGTTDFSSNTATVKALNSDNGVVGDNLVKTNDINDDDHACLDIVLNAPIMAGITYRVTVDNNSYDFSGIIDDAGILVERKGNVATTTYAAISFSGMGDTPYTTYDVTVYAINADGGIDLSSAEVVAENSLAKGAFYTDSTTLAIADSSVYVVVTRTLDGIVKYAAKTKVVDSIIK